MIAAILYWEFYRDVGDRCAWRANIYNVTRFRMLGNSIKWKKKKSNVSMKIFHNLKSNELRWISFEICYIVNRVNMFFSSYNYVQKIFLYVFVCLLYSLSLSLSVRQHRYQIPKNMILFIYSFLVMFIYFYLSLLVENICHSKYNF